MLGWGKTVMIESRNHVQGPEPALQLVGERGVDTAHGTKRVLVVEPAARVEVGRDRLARIRAGDGHNAIDAAVLNLVDAHRGVDAVVFRAHRGEGPTGWGYARDLSDPEVEELGTAMVRLQVDLYRRLADRGVFAIVGTEFGEREVRSFRRGTEAVAAGLERSLRTADAPAVARCRFDLWLLDHFAMWVGTEHGVFVAGGLPKLLDKVQRQRRRLERMRADLAAAS